VIAAGKPSGPSAPPKGPGAEETPSDFD